MKKRLDIRLRALAMCLLLGLGWQARAGAADPCVPPSGIRAWWSAESNGNDIAGSNTASAQNGAGYGVGRVGTAFSLDGIDDFYSVPDAPALRPTSLTVEGWFQFTSTASIRMLFAKSVGGGPLESFGVFLNAGSLSGLICDAGGFGPIISYPFAPTLGAWYHIAYTFDDAADTQVLYVDGVARASGPVSQSIAYDSNPLTIGAEYENQAPSYRFAGAIDELTLYDRPLAAGEVQAIFASGAAGKCSFVAPPTVNFTVEPTGGSYQAAGFGRFDFPSGILPAARLAEVAATTDLDGGEPYRLAESIFQLGQHLPFETRLRISADAPQLPVTIHLALPASFVAQLPVDHVPLVLGAMSQVGELDSIYVVEPLETIVVGDSATVTCGPEMFVPRDLGGSPVYELILIVASRPVPPPIADVSSWGPAARAGIASRRSETDAASNAHCPAEPMSRPTAIEPNPDDVFGAISVRADGSRYTHLGQDYPVAPGTAVRVADAGVVERIFDQGAAGFGKYVTVRHSHGVTLYAHLALVRVTVGQVVAKGHIIALAGNTGGSSGPHIHQEYLPGWASVEASDPGRADPLPCSPSTIAWGIFGVTCGTVSAGSTAGELVYALSPETYLSHADGDLQSVTVGEASAGPGGLGLQLKSALYTIRPTLRLEGLSSKALGGAAHATFNDFVFYRPGATPGELIPITMSLFGVATSTIADAGVISAGAAAASARVQVNATVNGVPIDFGMAWSTESCGGPPETCVPGFSSIPGVPLVNGLPVASPVVLVPVNIPVTVGLDISGLAINSWSIDGTIGGAPTSLTAFSAIGQVFSIPASPAASSDGQAVSTQDGLRPAYVYFANGNIFGVPPDVTVSSSSAGIYDNQLVTPRTLDAPPPSPDDPIAGPALQMIGPNPCRDAIRFRIREATGGRLQIVDIQGRSVFTHTLEAGGAGPSLVTMPTGELRAGVYYARWTSSAGAARSAVRFVKVR